MSAALRDLRLALRALRRAPAFALAAVLCLALGVGANAAVFSAARAVLVRPVAAPDPHRLVVVREELPRLKLFDAELAPPELFDVAARRDVFAAVGGYSTASLTLVEDAGSTRYRAVRTYGDYFAAFGVRPQLGRLLADADSRGGRHQVVLLSDGFWRERFGADPSVVGRPLRFSRATYTVVGVLPPGFRYPRDAQLYVPAVVVDSALAGQRGNLNVNVVARLRDGVTVAQAQGALAGLARGWRAEHGGMYERGAITLSVHPFVAYDAGQLRPVLLLLLAAVALVLGVACVNVAGLQLVRVTVRARELAVRAALGAGRAALARQTLAEGAVIAAAGGALGVALGWALTRAFVRLAPADLLALRDLRLDAPALGGAAAAALGAAVLAGALPAARAGRADVRGVLAEGARGSSAGRARHGALRGAVVTQLALSTVLLLGTGLLVRSLGRLLDVAPGFQPARVVTATVGVPFDRYGSTAASNAFYAALLERLRAAPGVQYAALTSRVPLSGPETTNSSPFRVIGRDTAGQGDPPHANIQWASRDYFRAMGIPLLRGRTFGPQDDRRPDGPGAAMSFVIDAALARRYFPGEDPIGRRINQGPDGVIIGVVGEVRDASLRDSTKATVYYNYAQGWTSNYTVVVRSTLADAAAAGAIRAAVRALDPQLPVYEVAALPDVVRRSVGARRFGAAVLAGFAGLALVLAGLGVYGVLTYVVAQRTRELGIRSALGATASQVRRLVLGDGARLAALGVAAGAAAFLAGGGLVASQLYGVGPRDPLTIAVGAAVLGAVALLASYLPARRATRVDPASALRAE